MGSYDGSSTKSDVFVQFIEKFKKYCTYFIVEESQQVEVLLSLLRGKAHRIVSNKVCVTQHCFLTLTAIEEFLREECVEKPPSDTVLLEKLKSLKLTNGLG